MRTSVKTILSLFLTTATLPTLTWASNNEATLIEGLTGKLPHLSLAATSSNESTVGMETRAAAAPSSMSSILTPTQIDQHIKQMLAEMAADNAKVCALGGQPLFFSGDQNGITIKGFEPRLEAINKALQTIFVRKDALKDAKLPENFLELLGTTKSEGVEAMRQILMHHRDLLGKASDACQKFANERNIKPQDYTMLDQHCAQTVALKKFHTAYKDLLIPFTKQDKSIEDAFDEISTRLQTLSETLITKYKGIKHKMLLKSPDYNNGREALPELASYFKKQSDEFLEGRQYNSAYFSELLMKVSTAQQTVTFEDAKVILSHLNALLPILYCTIRDHQVGSKNYEGLLKTFKEANTAVSAAHFLSRFQGTFQRLATRFRNYHELLPGLYYVVEKIKSLHPDLDCTHSLNEKWPGYKALSERAQRAIDPLTFPDMLNLDPHTIPVDGDSVKLTLQLFARTLAQYTLIYKEFIEKISQYSRAQFETLENEYIGSDPKKQAERALFVSTVIKAAVKKQKASLAKKLMGTIRKHSGKNLVALKGDALTVAVLEIVRDHPVLSMLSKQNLPNPATDNAWSQYPSKTAEGSKVPTALGKTESTESTTSID